MMVLCELGSICLFQHINKHICHPVWGKQGCMNNNYCCVTCTGNDNCSRHEQYGFDITFLKKMLKERQIDG